MRNDIWDYYCTSGVIIRIQSSLIIFAGIIFAKPHYLCQASLIGFPPGDNFVFDFNVRSIFWTSLLQFVELISKISSKISTTNISGDMNFFGENLIIVAKPHYLCRFFPCLKAKIMREDCIKYKIIKKIL